MENIDFSYDRKYQENGKQKKMKNNKCLRGEYWLPGKTEKWHHFSFTIWHILSVSSLPASYHS